MQHEMSQCVHACVLGDDLPLFISDLSYATRVIQHVEPMGRLPPCSALDARARGSHSVSGVSTSSPAVALLHLLKN